MTPLDEKWFARLQDAQATIGETFALLEPSADELTTKRQVFEASNYTTAVELYPDADVVTQFAQPEMALEQLLSDIQESETNQIVRDEYIAYIKDALLNMQLVRAAASRDDVMYEALNRQLYGMPDKNIYRAVVHWIALNAKKSNVNASAKLRQLRDDMLQLLPNETGDVKKIIPSNATFDRVRALHFAPDGLFPRLFGTDGLPEIPAVDRVTGDAICEQVLARIDASDYVITDAPNVTWAVSRVPKQLFRPHEYDLTRTDFVGLIGHEIGSHILESINGAKQPLRLFELGLAGYLFGNEGRGLLREQVVYSSINEALAQPAWEYNILKHLAVSLALGYNGDERYDFPRLYRTLYSLYRFWRERRYPDHPINESFARKHAWFLCVRIMKGTAGHDGCYHKDIVYLEGISGLWQLAVKNPEIIMLGDQAKFNLLDARQRKLFADLQK